MWMKIHENHLQPLLDQRTYHSSHHTLKLILVSVTIQIVEYSNAEKIKAIQSVERIL